MENMKLAAEKLFKIADALEKEASENTFFVCDNCNHTASLADINAKRKTAGTKHSVKKIASVTVNDEVSCVACGGKMAYVPTGDSTKYYVEAENTEDTGADIFEPVDEQGKDKTDEATPSDETALETVPGEIPTDETPTDEATPSNETTPDEGKAPEDSSGIMDYDQPEGDMAEEDKTPTDEAAPEEGTSPIDVADVKENVPAEGESPEGDAIPSADVDTESDVLPNSEGDTPEGDTTPESDAAPTDEVAPEGEEPVVEETVPGDTAEVPAVGEEDQSDENIDVPKKEVPKFEKMPKEAQDAFWRSVAKYSV